MRSNPILKKQNGGALLIVLIVLIVSFSLLVGTFASLGIASFQQSLIQNNGDKHKIKTVLTAFCRDSLSHNQRVQIDKDQLTHTLKWALNTHEIVVSNITETRVAPLNYAFDDLYINKPHLQERLLKGSIRLHTKTLSFVIRIAQHPLPNFQLVCNHVWYLNTHTIPLKIEGISMINGIQVVNDTPHISIQQCFTPFLLGNTNFVHCNSLYKDKKLVSNCLSHNARRQDATIVRFDGNNVLPAIPGLSVENFANANRLKIKLSAVTVPKLMVECTTPIAERCGIVLEGHNTAVPLKSLISNGRVWLMGSHTGSPIVIENQSPYWSFSPKAFDAGNIPAASTIIWNACCIACQQRSLFSTTGNTTLQINGTLVCKGAIEGSSPIIIKPLLHADSLYPFIETLETLSYIEITS